jgi:hypothetical protein
MKKNNRVKLSSKQLEILKDCRLPKRYNSSHRSVEKLININFIAKVEELIFVIGEHPKYQITDAGRAWLNAEADARIEYFDKIDNLERT